MDSFLLVSMKKALLGATKLPLQPYGLKSKKTGEHHTFTGLERYGSSPVRYIY